MLVIVARVSKAAIMDQCAVHHQLC